jgi:hypothetical protein
MAVAKTSHKAISHLGRKQALHVGQARNLKLLRLTKDDLAVQALKKRGGREQNGAIGKRMIVALPYITQVVYIGDARQCGQALAHNIAIWAMEAGSYGCPCRSAMRATATTRAFAFVLISVLQQRTSSANSLADRARRQVQKAVAVAVDVGKEGRDTGMRPVCSNQRGRVPENVRLGNGAVNICEAAAAGT